MVLFILGPMCGVFFFSLGDGIGGYEKPNPPARVMFAEETCWKSCRIPIGWLMKKEAFLKRTP